MLLKRIKVSNGFIIGLAMFLFPLCLFCGCGYKKLNIFSNISINKSSFRIIKWDGNSLDIYNFAGTDKEKHGLLDRLNNTEGKEISVSKINKLPMYVLLLKNDDLSENRDSTESVLYTVFADDLLFFEGHQFKTKIDMDRIIEDYTYEKEEQPFYGVNPYILYASRITPFYQLQKQNNSWNKKYLTKAHLFPKEKNISYILNRGDGNRSLNLDICNNNTELITAKEWFNVQVLLEEEWYVVPFKTDIVFPDYYENRQYDMITLEPGVTLNFTFNLSDYYDEFPEGKYRISYGNITVEFEVDASGNLVV